MNRTDADRLREAIVEIRKLRTQLAGLSAERTPPVAVIGAACRIHGGADDPDKFWEILRSGRDCIVETPKERWDLDEWYSPEFDTPGKLNTRWGGYLDGLALFDPDCFGISDREARSMDPQQRLLLEVSWEALEASAQPLSRLHDSRTGVFVALNNNEYFQMAMERSPDELDSYTISGGVHSTAAGRISYLLGLRGPSLSVDTACSSSLTAAHLAVQSLRSRECRMAIAGGVHLTLRPNLTVGLSRLQMIAPDGCCKAFDAAADGFVQGEGCVVFVLKLLSDAIGDRDPILAVIRGTAINQDGRSSGLTAPSGPAQEDVIRTALEESGLSAADIDFVETHGTGTALGDPLEARALGAVYCRSQQRSAPLWLGACKTNYGHLGPASGVAGMLKLIACMNHGEIPANLHLRTPSPFIEWDQLQLALPSALRSWPSERRRRAGAVSSFGFSGTNVHMVLEEYRREEPLGTELAPEPSMLCLSGRNPSVLRTVVERFAQYLEQTSETWSAICHTAGAGRDHAAHRIAVLASSNSEAASKLRDYLAGNLELTSGTVLAHPAPKIAWVFENSGDIRCESDRLRELLAAMEAWRRAGFHPDFVCGEGLASLSAGCAAGALTAEEANNLLEGELLPDRPVTLHSRWIHPSTGQLLERSSAAEFRLLKGDALSTMQRSNPKFTLVLNASSRLTLETLASLYVAGFVPDWNAISIGKETRRVALPATPFERRRFWAFDDNTHAFHGRKVPLAGGGDVWEMRVSPNSPAYVQDHKIAGDIVLPGAWYVAWSLALRGAGKPVRDVAFHTPLHLDSPEGWSVQVRRTDGGQLSFYASKRANDWLHLATVQTGTAEMAPPARRSWISRLGIISRIGSREDHVAAAQERNVQLGPSFRSIAEIYGGEKEVFARLVRPAILTGSDADAHWHPAILDACLQLCGHLTADHETWIPAAIDEAIFWAPAPDEFWCRASVSGPQNEGTLQADVECVDLSGEPLLSIRGAVFLKLQNIRHLRTGRTQHIHNWFYNFEWDRVTSPEHREFRRVALVGGPAAFKDQLKTALENFGNEVTFCADAVISSDAIVFLEPLAWIDGSGFERSEFDASVRQLRNTLRELADAAETKQPDLWFAISAAQKVSAGDVPDPVRAAWWGMCSTIAPEMSQFRVYRVDLNPTEGGSANVLAALLSSADLVEDEWALRSGHCYSPRLRTYAVDQRAWRPSPDALYLITGGTGGIGMAVADDLVSRGARHLVLAARHAPAAHLQARLTTMERKGARVQTLEADLSSEHSTRSLVECCCKTGTPFRGIFHAAGTVRDGLFLDLRDDQWDAVWSAKVKGALYLDRFTENVELDCFVLFSSICAYMGAAGQANYAAANAALDALAYKRRWSGRPALSINWGAWSEVGMAAAMGEFGERRLDQLGFEAMTPREGCEALFHVMSSDACNVTVLPPVRWLPLLEKLHAGQIPSRLQPFAESKSQKVHPDLSQLSGCDPDALVQVLQKMAAGILGSNGKLPEPDRPLLSIGFDSLTAMEMRASLLRTMGTNVPVSSLLTGATLRDLASLCSSTSQPQEERELFEV